MNRHYLLTESMHAEMLQKMFAPLSMTPLRHWLPNPRNGTRVTAALQRASPVLALGNRVHGEASLSARLDIDCSTVTM